MKTAKSKLTLEEKRSITRRQRQIIEWGTPEKQYKDSGLWRFLGYVKTKDEHDSVNPVKNLPPKQYVVETFRAMLHYPVLAVPKSRQVMVSWMLAAFCCWFIRTRPFCKIMWQAQKEGDAENMVSKGDKEETTGRMSFIEYHLPPWLQDPYVRVGLGNKVGKLVHSPKSKTRSGIPNLWYGSQVVAVPQGADQVRSHVPTLYVIDEAAFQEEFMKAFTTALPAVKGGGRIIAVSSANPGDFADLVLEGVEDWGSWAEVAA